MWMIFIAGGLKRDNLKMVITDGSKALHAALDMVYPLTLRQACWAHKLRNVSSYLPKRHQDDCLVELFGIYNAKSKS